MDLEGGCAEGKLPTPAHTITLAASPAYPNAVKWSEDNLIAVATGHLITVLNPGFLEGPRGSLAISASSLFNIGTVNASDLHAPCLQPLCLSRDGRAGIRCIDWSPQGVAANGGCLLALCTTDHRVKLYRAPYCEFQSDWVEVMDLSELLYTHLCRSKFIKTNEPASTSAPNNISQEKGLQPLGGSKSRGKRSGSSIKEPQHRKEKKTGEDSRLVEGLNGGVDLSVMELNTATVKPSNQTILGVPVDRPSVIGIKGMEGNGGETWTSQDKDWRSCISPSTYVARSNMLAHLVVAWSSKVHLKCIMDGFDSCKAENFALIAIGTKSGEVSLLRVRYPQQYTIEKSNSVPDVSLLGIIQAHGSWVTALCWGKFQKNEDERQGHLADVYEEEIFLVTGSFDGSVKIWSGDTQAFGHVPSSYGNAPLILVRQVLFEDCMPITSLALSRSPTINHFLVAVGKGSGGLAAWECHISGNCIKEAYQLQAHSQGVTGVVWGFNGRCLYSCSQDNMLQAWIFHGNQLFPVPFSEGSALVKTGASDVTHDLPSSVMDCFYGLALSKGSLALVSVRSIATEMVDPMYQSRCHKGAVQFFWIGGQHFSENLKSMSLKVHDPGSNISESDLAQWEFNLLSSLRHFEDVKQTLVLWDIVASLRALKIAAGNGFFNSIMFKWLLSCGIAKPESQDETFRHVAKDLQQQFSHFTSRRLQMLNVLCRWLHLADSKAEVISGRGLQRSENGSILSLEEGSNNADQSSSMFLNQEKYWLKFVLQVEHELRQRLVCLALYSVACQRSNLLKSGQRSKKLQSSVLSGISGMLQWVVANPSRLSSSLLAVASKWARRVTPETCVFCNTLVPFDSVEEAYCQGYKRHKFQRCAVSFKVCPPCSLWFCYCCARWAAEQTSEVFFTLSSTQIVEQLPQSTLFPIYSRPCCPFCGILMQRLLPDCFLRLSLV